MAQQSRSCLLTQKMQVWSQVQEYPLEKEMATHSSIVTREIPWTEEPGRLWSIDHKESGTTVTGWADSCDHQSELGILSSEGRGIHLPASLSADHAAQTWSLTIWGTMISLKVQQNGMYCCHQMIRTSPYSGLDRCANLQFLQTSNSWDSGVISLSLLNMLKIPCWPPSISQPATPTPDTAAPRGELWCASLQGGRAVRVGPELWSGSPPFHTRMYKKWYVSSHFS